MLFSCTHTRFSLPASAFGVFLSRQDRFSLPAPTSGLFLPRAKGLCAWLLAREASEKGWRAQSRLPGRDLAHVPTPEGHLRRYSAHSPFDLYSTLIIPVFRLRRSGSSGVRFAHSHHIPGIPMAFTASFYSGLGPMLVVAAVRFMAAARVA